MSSLSDYTEGKLLDLIFGAVAWMPAATYVSLWVADPTDANIIAGEVSGGAYARVLVNRNGSTSPFWTANESDGAGGLRRKNSGIITFPDATLDWGSVGWVGIHDAATSGNLIFLGALQAVKLIQAGDTFRFKDGELKVSFR